MLEHSSACSVGAFGCRASSHWPPLHPSSHFDFEVSVWQLPEPQSWLSSIIPARVCDFYQVHPSVQAFLTESLDPASYQLHGI